MNMNDLPAATDRSALLKKLQAEDFAIYEAALYLDAHPKCQKALQFYAEHQKLRAALKEEYQRKYGPLTLYENQFGTAWQWTKGPWPWEKEAN